VWLTSHDFKNFLYFYRPQNVSYAYVSDSDFCSWKIIVMSGSQVFFGSTNLSRSQSYNLWDFFIIYFCAIDEALRPYWYGRMDQIYTCICIILFNIDRDVSPNTRLSNKTAWKWNAKKPLTRFFPPGKLKSLVSRTSWSWNT